MITALLTFLVLAAFALTIVGAWAMVRIGDAHDKAMADAIEEKADQIVKDLQERVAQREGLHG